MLRSEDYTVLINHILGRTKKTIDSKLLRCISYLLLANILLQTERYVLSHDYAYWHLQSLMSKFHIHAHRSNTLSLFIQEDIRLFVFLVIHRSPM